MTINLALQQAGAELVSVSENIDQTPSGLLLHGIMSAIAEFYSCNLATEIIKGSVQKAKNGGTPGRVPLGYRNVRQIEKGYEVRTVAVDPERGPLMAWAFTAYATGDWTILTLLAELTRRGLTTAPGPKTPSKPLSDSQLYTLLRHPYYMGLVRYRGVLYPGKHSRLVEPETWQQVQDLLGAKYLVGEKHREHPHYFKGSIYCGTCGARLIVNHAKGRHGGIYPYFICIGRQKDKHSCNQRALRIELIEEAVAARYATVQLAEDELVRSAPSRKKNCPTCGSGPSTNGRPRSAGSAGLKPNGRRCWMRIWPTRCRSTCSRASRKASRPSWPPPRGA